MHSVLCAFEEVCSFLYAIYLTYNFSSRSLDILTRLIGCCTAAFVIAKLVNAGDNMEAIRAFTRPVIFTLSLNFIFVIIYPSCLTYLFHDFSGEDFHAKGTSLRHAALLLMALCP